MHLSSQFDAKEETGAKRTSTWIVLMGGARTATPPLYKHGR